MHQSMVLTYISAVVEFDLLISYTNQSTNVLFIYIYISYNTHNMAQWWQGLFNLCTYAITHAADEQPQTLACNACWHIFFSQRLMTILVMMIWRTHRITASISSGWSRCYVAAGIDAFRFHLQQIQHTFRFQLQEM